MSNTPRDELAQRLARYPKQAIQFFDAGLSLVGGLPDEARKRVVDHVVANFNLGSRHLGGSSLVSITNLSESDSEQIASIYSLIIGLVSDIKVTVEEFLDVAKGVLFSGENAATARSIATAVVGAREDIRGAVKLAQLAGEVLPSFDGLHFAIDIRVRVSEGEVVTSVPVAIMHLDTDITDEEIWCQLSMSDVIEISKKLEKCLADMKVAQAFISRKS